MMISSLPFLVFLLFPLFHVCLIGQIYIFGLNQVQSAHLREAYINFMRSHNARQPPAILQSSSLDREIHN